MIYPASTVLLRDGRTCTLRSPAAEDAAALLDYIKTVMGETPYLLRTPEEFDIPLEKEEAFIARMSEAARAVLIVAEMDGKIVADCDLQPRGAAQRLLHRAGMGVSVRKEYWRLGLGSALMEALIACARDLRYEQLELEVVADNRRAVSLYLKYGFQVYGTRPHGLKYADGSYADEYMMVKKL